MGKCRLVADIGGTNSRLGLVLGGVLGKEGMRSYRNDDFDSFTDVFATYASELGDIEIEEVVIAIGGPVLRTKGRLTNREWHFDAVQLREVFKCKNVQLINDLTAFGHAIHALEDSSLDQIIPRRAVGASQGQALVVGIGTGFNVGPVIRTESRVVCAVAEYGHVPLPQDVHARVAERLGPVAQDFPTIEHVFSGRGYKRLKQLLCEDNGTQTPLSDEEFLDFYAMLLAYLTRGLMLAFLPRDGIYFSGSVARNLLDTSARRVFTEKLGAPFALDVDLVVPVASILDDSAALFGCARYPIRENTCE